MRFSQGASGTVDRAKVVVTLNKYDRATGDWAEAYATMSVAETAIFIELGYERALEQFERFRRNPVVDRPVYFDAQGREVEVYDPEGWFENRTARLNEQEVANRRTSLERDYRWRLALHRTSVERYGLSYNAINGAQLDELLADVPPEGY